MVRARLLPASAGPDAPRLLTTRALRAFADGWVSAILPAYLTLVGWSAAQIGALATVTMLGSAALTLLAGLHGHRIGRRRALLATAIVMAATGLGFSVFTSFIALLIIAALGTLNPSAGDVSVFLPLEQSLLPESVADRDRTALFARYALTGALVAAAGAACAGVPAAVARHSALNSEDAYRSVFAVYTAVALAVFAIYRRLRVEPTPARHSAALGPSKRTVYRLAAVFSIDSFGSGFASQAILILWLHRRFGLSVGRTGAILAAIGIMSAVSILAAEHLARRIGLIRTMAFTHLPASALFVVAAVMPHAGLAVAVLIVRAVFSQMDIPARTSYVMAVVTPPERAAAASLTNVPRSLAGALPPVLAGLLLDRSTFGWPLVIAGVLRVGYDLTLLSLFGRLRPPEEAAGPSGGPHSGLANTAR